MSGLYEFTRSALFQLDAERAHRLSILALRTGLIRPQPCPNDAKLEQTLFGLAFKNPVGLAAGYDKNGEVVRPILRLGFAATEVGTLTPEPQSGNPKPRIFRLEQDLAVINRLGFNNDGHAAALTRLGGQDFSQAGIVGINIGANKTSQDFVADYAAGLRNFWEIADYFTANISSPNTPGLRELQAKQALQDMLARLQEQREQLAEKFGYSRPILLKIAPDLDEHQMDDIGHVVNESSLDGLIVSNTTLARPDTLKSDLRGEAGGLSGKPLFQRSTIVLAKMRLRLNSKIPCIGVGGVHDVQSAINKLAAGAALIQLYSGMVYGGPALPGAIVRGLSDHLATKRLSHLSALIGSQTRDWAAQPLST